MIREASFHRRSHSERLVDTAEIVIGVGSRGEKFKAAHYRHMPQFLSALRNERDRPPGRREGEGMRHGEVDDLPGENIEN